MRLVTYWNKEGIAQIGLLDERDHVLETGVWADHFFRQGLLGLSEIDPDRRFETVTTDFSDLRLAPVVPNPSKIICVGLNYKAHVTESKMDVPEQPLLFSKYSNTLTAHDASVPIDSTWKQVDYEAELAVIIGKTACRVPVKGALDYVLGYTIANDLSERSLQFRTSQWLLGKSLDSFLPLGPVLVTKDAIADPHALSIKGWLNSDLRQSSSTQDMIFSIAEIISYASQYMTLFPGDVILTGTPEGVALGKGEGAYILPGDTFTIEIEQLGTLRNTFVERSDK